MNELKAKLEKWAESAPGESCGEWVFHRGRMDAVELLWPVIEDLREGLAEVIRNSNDILAKKHCSRVIHEGKLADLERTLSDFKTKRDQAAEAIRGEREKL